MSIYSSLSARSAAMGEHNDCSVRALAVACNISYEEAHAAMEQVGREKGKGAYTYQTEKALDLLGYEYKAAYSWEKEYRDIIASYPGRAKNLKHITTYHPIRYKEIWAEQPNMIFCTRGHVAGFANGQLHDWASKRQKQCRSIIIITGTPPTDPDPNPYKVGDKVKQKDYPDLEGVVTKIVNYCFCMVSLNRWEHEEYTILCHIDELSTLKGE